MHDSILDEIWRVRAELLKKYGGFEGVFKQVQKIDRARARLKRKRKKATGKRQPAAR